MPAKSKAQQRLFGMVHAYQKGKLKHAPASVKRIAKHISKEDARHFAETKHDELPERKKDMEKESELTRYEIGFLTKCAEYGLDESTSVRLMRKSAATPRGVRSMVDIFANGSPEKVRQAVRWLKRLGFAGSTSDLAKIHGVVKAKKPVGAAALADALFPAVQHENEHGMSLIRSLVNNGPKITKTFPEFEYLLRGVDDATLQRAVENGLKATGRKNPKGYVDELVLQQIANRVNRGQQLAKLLKGKKVKISPSRTTSVDTAKTFLDAVQNGRKGPMFDGYYPGRYETV